MYICLVEAELTVRAFENGQCVTTDRHLGDGQSVTTDRYLGDGEHGEFYLST